MMTMMMKMKMGKKSQKLNISILNCYFDEKLLDAHFSERTLVLGQRGRSLSHLEKRLGPLPVSPVTSHLSKRSQEVIKDVVFRDHRWSLTDASGKKRSSRDARLRPDHDADSLNFSSVEVLWIDHFSVGSVVRDQSMILVRVHRQNRESLQSWAADREDD